MAVLQKERRDYICRRGVKMSPGARLTAVCVGAALRWAGNWSCGGHGVYRTVTDDTGARRDLTGVWHIRPAGGHESVTYQRSDRKMCQRLGASSQDIIDVDRMLERMSQKQHICLLLEHLKMKTQASNNIITHITYSQMITKEQWKPYYCLTLILVQTCLTSSIKHISKHMKCMRTSLEIELFFSSFLTAVCVFDHHTVLRLFCLSFCSGEVDCTLSCLSELSVCTSLSLDLKSLKGDLKRLWGGSSHLCLLSSCLLIWQVILRMRFWRKAPPMP